MNENMGKESYGSAEHANLKQNNDQLASRCFMTRLVETMRGYMKMTLVIVTVTLIGLIL